MDWRQRGESKEEEGKLETKFLSLFAFSDFFFLCSTDVPRIEASLHNWIKLNWKSEGTLEDKERDANQQKQTVDSGFFESSQLGHFKDKPQSQTKVLLVFSGVFIECFSFEINSQDTQEEGGIHEVATQADSVSH